MDIVLTLNDGYASQAAACMCSVMENNRDADNITFHVLGLNLSTATQEKFKQFAGSYGRNLELYSIKDLSEELGYDFKVTGWHPIVLARLLIDRYLPEEIGRVLYLDCDTIVLDSLADLWNTDLGKCVLGGCIEATFDRKKRMALMGNAPYINAGVLLIDLDKWRKQNVGKNILTFYREYGEQLFTSDQDSINAVLKDEIFYLPPKYNFYNIYWFYNYRVLQGLLKDSHYYSKEVYEESVQNPAIIHYLGEERPWRRGNHHKFKSEYVKYKSMTEWKQEPEETGWETYFKLWDMFNVVMTPFPSLRYQIMNRLIPHFIEHRRKNMQNQLKNKG